MKRVFLCLALMLAVVVTAAPPPVMAQTGADQAETGPDYKVWEKFAKSAESVTAARSASDEDLERLRVQLVDWRSQFQTAQSTNQTRIETTREQIAALGPVPEQSQTEPAEIAARRNALNNQLTQLQAPGLAADEAYRRADGLIREIDAIIRERQANELMRLGPSPLNPALWSEGAGAAAATLQKVADETAAAWAGNNTRAALRARLPLALLYLAIAAVLLLRGRGWMEALSRRLTHGRSRGRMAYATLISLGQVALPLIGLYALIQAAEATGWVGPVGRQVLGLLPQAGLLAFFALWLGGQLFPRDASASSPLNLPPERMTEARWLTAGLGLVAALGGLVARLAAWESYSEAARAVLGFPALLLAGVLILRLGRLLLLHVRAENAAGGDHRYRDQLIGLIGRVIIITGIAAPLLAALGYARAADFFTYPAIVTMALLGTLVVLQRFVSQLYAAVTGDVETASDALIPVLIGFVLTLMALPVLALIWGARVADLTEMWTRFTEGFMVGGTRISPSDFVTFAIIFAVGYMLTRLFQGALRSSVLPKTKIDTGGRNAIVSGTGYVGIFVAGLIAITATGIDLSSLAIVAGALSVGIGFGLQNIVSNFVSGIILLIERPVSEGDWIEVGGTMGIVRDISVRSTRVETFDRTEVIVPNSDLISGAVVNWTKSNVTGRLILPVGVAYGTDTRKVEKILQEVAASHPIVVMTPPPQVLFRGFGADSLDFEIRIILRDIAQILNVRSELNHLINSRFIEAGIEIPFAQRDVWLRNPETLRAAPASPNVPERAPTERP